MWAKFAEKSNFCTSEIEFLGKIEFLTFLADRLFEKMPKKKPDFNNKEGIVPVLQNYLFFWKILF